MKAENVDEETKAKAARLDDLINTFMTTVKEEIGEEVKLLFIGSIPPADSKYSALVCVANDERVGTFMAIDYLNSMLHKVIDEKMQLTNALDEISTQLNEIANASTLNETDLKTEN